MGAEAGQNDKLINRYRKHSKTFKAVQTEGALMAESLNVNKQDIGGEGVLIVHAAKQTKLDSGYWFVTLFAIRGRAFQPWPTVLYTIYVVTIVSVVQLSPSLRNFKDNNQLVFQGLQVSVSLVGVALFFLQTFRTNSAYNRWWEGRIVWGAMSHNLIGIATSVTAGNVHSRKLARRLLRWAIAFLTTLKLGLRADTSLGELQDVLSPSELAQLQSLALPLRAIHCISCLKAAWGEAERGKYISKCAARELERVVPEITIAMGSVRRIMSTPMPFAYVSHARTFLLIWISVLPFVFMYYMSWLAIGVCIIIAYSLLGMEAISLEIEAPFGRDFNDLPIDNLADDTILVLLNAYEETRKLPTPDGCDGDGDWGLEWSDVPSNNLGSLQSIMAASRLASRVDMQASVGSCQGAARAAAPLRASPSPQSTRPTLEEEAQVSGGGGAADVSQKGVSGGAGAVANPELDPSTPALETSGTRQPSAMWGPSETGVSGGAVAVANPDLDPRTPSLETGVRQPSAMWGPSPGAAAELAGGPPSRPGTAGGGSSRSPSGLVRSPKVAPTLHD